MKIVTIAVVGTMMLTACSGSSPQPAPTVSQETLLARELGKRLDGRVVGYSVLVGDQQLAGGWARTKADAPALPMSARVPVNQASVGKMFTTIALMRTLARQGKSVDDPIAPYLPKTWKKGEGVDRLTFRALLTHRSGFRYESNYVFETDHAARDAIADGVDAVPAGSPAAYNNINFAIVLDLLPQLLGRRVPFLDWLDEEVFQPSGVTAVRCSAKDGDMLIYPSVSSLSDQDHGQVPVQVPPACSPGGEVMDEQAVLAVLKALLAGKLLTPAQRQQLDDGCLGWDCSVQTQTGFRGKAGGLSGGPAFLETYAGVVRGIPFVVAINSAVPVGAGSGPTVSGLGLVVSQAVGAIS